MSDESRVERLEDRFDYPKAEFCIHFFGDAEPLYACEITGIVPTLDHCERCRLVEDRNKRLIIFEDVGGRGD